VWMGRNSNTPGANGALRQDDSCRWWETGWVAVTTPVLVRVMSGKTRLDTPSVGIALSSDWYTRKVTQRADRRSGMKQDPPALSKI
jgi:hypothetical protein